MNSEPIDDEDDLLAAELALGLLDEPERTAAEERLALDPVFASAHARWLRHMTAMFTAPGEVPRPSIWQNIEARLPANDDDRGMVSRTALRRWQAGALITTTAAIVLGFVAAQRPVRAPIPAAVVRIPAAVVRPAAAPLLAVMTGRAGSAAISFDAASGRITSAASGLRIGRHVPELWVIPADGKPRSLGLLDPSTARWRMVSAAAAAAMKPGATVAVSSEQAGGSRSGQPTGPVILTGKLASI